MKNDKHVSQLWKISIIILLFIGLLSAARFAWIQTFADEKNANIMDGELDLRTDNTTEDDILALDGVWEFYPSTFLMEESGALPEMITVPGDWSPYLQSKASEASYGYGSYRLRILVDPDDDHTYSIRVPSVRSASELYVNGNKVGSSGAVGKSKDTYTAKNLPYSTYFSAEDGVMDIVLQVANYRDPRGSGFVRSLKFSTKENLTKQTELSTGLQQIMLIVLLIHSVYAVILYFLGNRDKRLVYFALFSGSYMFMLSLGAEDKFLHVWLGLDYTFAFRLSNIALVAIGYFLYKSIQGLLRPVWKKVLLIYEVACFASVASIIVLPMHVFLNMNEIYFGLMFFAFVISMYVIILESLKQLNRNVALLLALTAFFNNAVWTFILMFSGIKVMYYPFDFIVAVICLAVFWFKHYFEMHRKSERLSIKLQEADKVKDEFLASTSHELRNPLHAILNMTHGVLEREDAVLEAASVKDLETVLSVGRRMSTMVNDLLDVMTLKEKTPRLHMKTFSIQSVTSGVFDMLKFMIEGRNVQLVNELPEDLPAVYADENRFIQILFNLVHNSVKFTAEGTITVTGYSDKGRVYVIVKDTGIGIAEEAIPTIFDRYEQARLREEMTEGGFGLGLSISKQLVELHGGALTVESERGVGSTFTFSVALAREAEQTTEPLVSLIEGLSNPVQRTEEPPPVQHSFMGDVRPRILVVDDDPINLQVVRTVLTVEKFDIRTVTSGEAALAILHKHAWDLVIADVMMPHMSGYELTREIRNRFTITELPILLLTARAQARDIEEGFFSGANDYVAKPVEALELRSRVYALTSVRKSMNEHLRMEAAWLHAQIQPHFLFNALNTIMALSEIDHKRMQDVLEAFTDFLRGKFNFHNVDDLIPIDDEIDLIEAYLYIEEQRFGDRLNVEWLLDDLEDIYIPPLTIQPLVENAIHHGIMSQIEGGTLRIRITKENGNVQVLVEDNGAGMTDEVQSHLLKHNEEGRTGVGLLNTHMRLKRQFGSGLDISSTLGKGTTITFTIPIIDE